MEDDSTSSEDYDEPDGFAGNIKRKLFGKKKHSKVEGKSVLQGEYSGHIIDNSIEREQLSGLRNIKPIIPLSSGSSYQEADLTFMISRINLNEDDYYMSFPNRGYAVIMNNVNFEVKELKTRKGAEMDVSNLEKKLTKLEFEVLVYTNTNKAEMMSAIEDMEKLDHSKFDCFMCIVLSHGEGKGHHGSIWTRDASLINLEDLANPIKNCATLVGKPKIFIIQACRGANIDEGNHIQSDSFEDGNLEDKYILNYPKEADFLWVHSSPFDYYSFRNKKEGSWFIQALCKALDKYGCQKNFLHILYYANFILTSDFGNEKSQKQTCNFSSALTKNLYFSPKLIV